MDPSNLWRDSVEASMHSWEEARSRLVPVIGERGFRILLERSLHLTRREHPWMVRLAEASERPLDDLQASLTAESEEQALAANRTLRVHFIGLLHTLIGEGLTNRLLDPLPASHDSGHGP